MRKLLSVIVIAFTGLIVIVPLLLLIHIYFLSEVEWLPRPTLARGWRTPEEAVQQTLGQGMDPWKPVANPTIVASFPVQRGWALLYVGQESSPTAAPAIGLATVKRGWRGWYLAGQMDLQSAALTNTSQSADFDIMTQTFSQQSFLIVIGRARTAEVSEVQVTFDTGRTMYGELYSQSFVMIDEGARGVCALRTLTAQRVEIETLQWSKCQNDQPFRTK